MNKDIIIQNIKPYLNSKKELLYSDFDDIFSCLELKEQYEVCDFLSSLGIEFVDEKSITDNYVDSSNIQNTSKKTIIVTKDNPISYNKKLTTKQRCKSKINKFLNESNEYLAELYQRTNDNRVLQILINKNKNYLFKKIKQQSYFYNHKLEDEDLFQIATMGFIKGCQRFDSTKGYNLLTYVTWWVDQTIQREIMDTGFIIRLPMHKWEEIKKISKQFSNFNDEFDNFSDVDIKKYKDVMVLKKHYLNPEYLDAYIGENQDIRILDTVSNSANFFISPIRNPEEYNIEIELRETVVKCLCCLSAKERDVLKLRYGLNDNDENEKTLNDIGKMFGLTRERIRQIEDKAKKKLKIELQKKKVDDFLNYTLQEPKIFDKQYFFKKKNVSYIPDIYTIAKRVINCNENTNDLDILYKNIVECLTQNSYNENSFSYNEIINIIKKIKGDNCVRNNQK